MLTDALKTMVNNLFKKKKFTEKKKTINILTIFFFISHKSNIKTFLK